MATINTYEGREIMVMDVPNAFIHTNMHPNKNCEERVIMKTICMLVDMLLELDSETYSKHVVFENGKKVIHIDVLRVIYGILLT